MKKKLAIGRIGKPDVIGSIELAREKFASHVQSIAFQLTLSRRMIECLRVVRDYGFPAIDDSPGQKQLEDKNRAVVKRQHRSSTHRAFITDNFVGFMRSLDNRGLVVWNEIPYVKRKPGERTLFLTKAGELTCLLLVEAGLMPVGKI
jgi:hypothetical protein